MPVSPFPLTTSSWIPVYDMDAAVFRDVGIREALTRSHRLSLSAQGQEHTVLLRLLAAAFDAAAGPTTYEEWAQAWQAPEPDAGRIAAYLDQWEHRLVLFHPDEPAFQSGYLTEYARDARVLDPAYLGGEGAAWFNPQLRYSPTGEYPRWEPAAAARNLLVLIGYDVAAIKRAAPGDPAGKSGRVYGAPLGHVAQMAHVDVQGATLKDTLLLNLPPQPRAPGDTPVWERPTPATPMAVREPTGRLDVLTWPSRRIRLHPDRDGRVDLVAWHDGDRLTDPWQQLAEHDPMSMWRKTKEDRWAPQHHLDNFDQIVPWKIAQAVLDPSGDEGGFAVRCGAAEHLARVLDEGLLADYGKLSAFASSVVHSNRHKVVITDVPWENVALATGRYLTGPEDRADLAASARTATAYLFQIQKIVKDLGQTYTPYAARLNFMTLYARWPRVAPLLEGSPVEGRKTWRAMLREAAEDLVTGLPLKIEDKARIGVLVEQALITTRFVSDASRVERTWKEGAKKAAKSPRTGRPTLRMLTAFGETKSVAAWSKDPRCVVSYPTLRTRAKALMETDDAEHIITAPGARGRTPAEEPPAAAPEPAAPGEPAGEAPATAPQPPAEPGGAAAEPAAAAERRCVNCGTVLDATVTKSRCDACRAARVSKDFAYRKEIAEAIFTPAKRTDLLERLAAGQELADACTALDLTPVRVHKFRAYDDGWGALLDKALMDGRNPDLNHGTEYAYKEGRCRCPECRVAHDALRGPRKTAT